MQKNLLWEAFSTLQRQDLREMAKFVRSPFFNGKPQLIGLFDYLRGCLEQKIVPDQDAAYLSAYPESKTTDLVKLRLANSDLLALLEHYWMYCEKFSDFERNKIRLAGVYRRKGLAKHFQITLKEARASRAAHNWRHAEYFNDQYLLEWEQFQFLSTQKRYDTFNLQEINELMDVTYLARKLRLVCLALSHQAVTGQSYQFGLLYAVLDRVGESERVHEPAIGLYFHACYFLGYKGSYDENHFFQFRTQLTRSFSQFPPDEQRTLFLLALNFCIKKSNTANSKTTWFRQTWELYKEALEYDILLENGQISRFSFNNIASVAVHLGEVDWAEQFIEKHLPQVERKFRAAASSLNFARIAYARKQYDAALAHLQSADYRDLISGMSARIIQLKIYYEMDAFELLDSHLDSIKTYLHRQRATGYHRDTYMEIVKTTKSLMRCNFNDINALRELHHVVATHPTLLEKEWFLGQISPFPPKITPPLPL
jgi:hypothetical protein